MTSYFIGTDYGTGTGGSIIYQYQWHGIEAIGTGYNCNCQPAAQGYANAATACSPYGLWAYSPGTNAVTSMANDAANVNVQLWHDTAWQGWNHQYVTQMEEARVAAPPTTEQQVAAAAQAVEQQRQREVASAKAEELLFRFLTPQQLRDYRDKGWFETVVNDKVYRINKGRVSGNIQVLDKAGKPHRQYCVHPENAHAIPVADSLLAQKLLLEGSEAEFLRLANMTPLR